MRKQITTTLDADLLKRIKVQAIEEDTNVAAILDKLMKEYLEKVGRGA